MCKNELDRRRSMATFCVDAGRSGRLMMRVGSTTVCVADWGVSSWLEEEEWAIELVMRVVLMIERLKKFAICTVGDPCDIKTGAPKESQKGIRASRHPCRKDGTRPASLLTAIS